MERPTPEQVAVARERLETWPRAATLHGDVATILAHLDAVEAERDANRHELDQLVQETLIPLQQELAEARAAIKQVDGNVTAWREGTRRAWLDLPAVKKAMEEG